MDNVFVNHKSQCTGWGNSEKKKYINEKIKTDFSRANNLPHKFTDVNTQATLWASSEAKTSQQTSHGYTLRGKGSLLW